MNRILIPIQVLIDPVAKWVHVAISMLFVILALFVLIYGKKYYKISMCIIAFLTGMNLHQFLFTQLLYIKHVRQVYHLLISLTCGILQIPLAYFSIERALECNGLYLAMRWIDLVNYLLIFLRLEDEGSKTLWLSLKIIAFFYLPYLTKSKKSMEQEKVIFQCQAGSTALWANIFEASFYLFINDFDDEYKFWVTLAVMCMIVLTINIFNIMQSDVEIMENWNYESNLDRKLKDENGDGQHSLFVSKGKPLQHSLTNFLKSFESDFGTENREKRTLTSNDEFNILSKMATLQEVNFVTFNEHFSELEKRSSLAPTKKEESNKVDQLNLDSTLLN